MDTNIRLVRSQLSVALKLLQTRQRHLRNSTERQSRHYNRVAHTEALIGLLEELLGVIEQDPDLWDDNPELVPF